MKYSMTLRFVTVEDNEILKTVVLNDDSKEAVLGAVKRSRLNGLYCPRGNYYPPYRLAYVETVGDPQPISDSEQRGEKHGNSDQEPAS